MKFYISGPIKDNDDYIQDFAEGVRQVCDLWHISRDEVVNPCLLGAELEERIGRQPSYAEYMRDDIKAMLDCDAIAMLRGWEHSAGARCEHLVAVMSGLVVTYL